MNSEKYIGLDVHQATISIAVMDSTGKVVMESILETKGATILEFFEGLRGTLSVTFEEGTWAAWLYDLLKPHVAKLVVCNPRKNALLKDGNKSDRIDARKLAELLYLNKLSSVYHGETGMRMLRELARSYLTIVKDTTRVMSRLKAVYRSWAIPCAGRDVFYTTGQRHQASHGASHTGAQDCGHHANSLEDGRKLRRRQTEIASRLSVSREEPSISGDLFLVVASWFLRRSGSSVSIPNACRRTVPLALSLCVNPMPSRITRKSTRPRVADRTMVDTVQPRVLASFRNRSALSLLINMQLLRWSKAKPETTGQDTRLERLSYLTRDWMPRTITEPPAEVEECS